MKCAPAYLEGRAVSPLTAALLSLSALRLGIFLVLGGCFLGASFPQGFVPRERHSPPAFQALNQGFLKPNQPQSRQIKPSREKKHWVPKPANYWSNPAKIAPKTPLKMTQKNREFCAKKLWLWISNQPVKPKNESAQFTMPAHLTFFRR
jgi:hypothetical protein